MALATQKSSTMIRSLFDEVFTKGNINKCEEFYAQDVKIHDAAFAEDLRGMKALKEAEQMYKAAFPGKKLTVEEILNADDKVIVRWKCTGTNKGELNGNPATNMPFTVTGISIYRIANDKIVEVWQNWDRLGLYEQLGEIERTHAFNS